ncbi:MAG TPA: DUF378 domain-containing protein [candidate division Zixibacteria bacterium]|nr:DUF378 domain-containing protein [candidate division Zixibacteria bacterium]MDD4917604.1 DUF378 domain-containing protein [candidate division Zixibacteria bacterium]MDM7972137.1 DUF378 domain-containing protein [candidate division Zixibacteria bacterium]HOD67041.1 DUF378 domain-containing protein [candidate division Zixibacteria bacterium]HPM37016.1 DUF378 domain-containing protein [candidate division Zixibacteria bacterium]
MRTFDAIPAALLVIGGLNWGLVGLFHIDLVALVLGDGTLLSRLIYVVVGLSAAYQAMQWKAIQRRRSGKAVAA